MSEALSSNAKAILLLTAPLIVGRSRANAALLTPGEYNKLAQHLQDRNREPADLTAPDADPLLDEFQRVIAKERIRGLLGRGFLLAQATERWHARAIWVVSRADADYPQRLKAGLKDHAPPVLYGCGDASILETGGLAVVGSRHVNDALIEYTQDLGRLAADAGQTLVSGGARGIDQAAMRGALEAGGKVAGVLADGLERAAVNREHRNRILEGQLVLISPWDPAAGFNVGHAMQRNKLIYGLADAACVVNSDFNKGGTWAGATEQLEKFRFVPVYVRASGESSAGLSELRKRGALAWPEPESADGLNAALRAKVTCEFSAQADLFDTDTAGASRRAMVRESVGHARGGADRAGS